MLLVQLARPTAVGFPEGIKVTVCYYGFNDRGPFYSLSTSCKVDMPQYNGTIGYQSLPA